MRQRLGGLVFVLAALAPAGTISAAALNQQDLLRHCVENHVNAVETANTLCKVFKCAGGPKPVDRAHEQRQCQCEINVLHADLPPADFDTYARFTFIQGGTVSKATEDALAKRNAPALVRMQHKCYPELYSRH